MGKITVKHYLNKSLSPRKEGDVELYPLYVQVIVNRTNYRFKSNFPFRDGYLRESDLLDLFVQNINENERKDIERIVEYLIQSNELELLTSENIKKYTEKLWDVLNKNFSILFEKESEILDNDYPSVLVLKSFNEIQEVIAFTESDIEQKFSENYNYCVIGLRALSREIILNSNKDLKMYEMTVFDFLHRNKYKSIMKVVKNYHGFYVGTDEENENEYRKVVDELKKLVELK
ncbi:MAG TPA: hypothetical protein DIW31_12455 [Bacteroidales bacterium]|nr:hypothetical protein [Bacteroidales bacterium]